MCHILQRSNNIIEFNAKVKVCVVRFMQISMIKRTAIYFNRNQLQYKENPLIIQPEEFIEILLDYMRNNIKLQILQI